MPAPYLGSLGRLLEVLSRDQPRALSYARCREGGPAAWSERARAALHERVDFEPQRPPLAPQVLARTPCEGYTRETVEFASTRHHRIRGELLLPAGAYPPYPAVLALHDHGGFYSHGRAKVVEGLDRSAALGDFVLRAYEGRHWGSDLAQRGYAVLAIDCLGWGERRLPVEDLPASLRRRLSRWPEDSLEWAGIYNTYVAQATPALDRHANFAGLSWMGVVLWDDRRSYEYLLTRPEIDPGRIACAGLSGGGWRSAYLFGAEPRLAAAGIVGWMARLAEQLLHPTRAHVGLFTAPSVYRYLDHPDVAAIGAPRPLMVQQCTQDELFSLEAMHLACEDIGQVYADWGHPERFEARFYDVPHSFTGRMQEELFAWLDGWLR